MKLLSERLAYIYAERPDLEGDRGQSGLIKASGASKSVVNQWLNNNIKSMDIRYALKIEESLGYSHIWLMIGEGNPKVSKVEQAPAQPDAMRLKCEDLQEFTLLSMYRLANETERKAFDGLARSIEGRVAGTTPAANQAKTGRQ